MTTRGDKYEKAFQAWLLDNRVSYVPIDQRKRQAFARSNLKSFDFLLYDTSGNLVIGELKGRLFKGTSLAAMSGLQCWVTVDDVQGLLQWQQVFTAGRDNALAVFIFAYCFDNIDVETDGREVYDFDNHKWFFMAVNVQDYQKFMTTRSPKWQTVSLNANKFRELAIPAEKLLLL